MGHVDMMNCVEMYVCIDLLKSIAILHPAQNLTPHLQHVLLK
jgi:hypothetical protein